MKRIDTYIIEKFKINKETIKVPQFAANFCDDFSIKDEDIIEAINKWCNEHEMTDAIIYMNKYYNELITIKADKYKYSVDKENFNIVKSIVGPDSIESKVIFSDKNKERILSTFSEALYIKYYHKEYALLKPIDIEKQ